jgi:hypothetical protein
MATDMLSMLTTGVTSQTEEANALQAEIAAATSDRTKMVHDYLTDENTEDETIKALQEFLDKANAEIEAQTKAGREYVMAKYLPNVDDSAIEAKTKQFDELVKQIKAAKKFAATIPGYSDDTLKDVPALKTLRGGTASGGTGSKRPRLQRVSYRTATNQPWVAVETERDGKTVTNFSLLAVALKEAFKAKVEVKDLQAAAFAEAGTDDLSTLDGHVFDFAITVGDKNVFVQVQPKAADDA